jgi:hypothetical protein
VWVSVPAATGFVLLFAVTAGVALVGLVLSLGLRNYRFHTDGSRLGARSTARAEPAPAAEEPAPVPMAEPSP